MTRGLLPVLCLYVLGPAFAEAVEERSVIQDASVSILDPLFRVGIFRRLLNTRHLPDDGEQHTGINVLNEVLRVIIGKRFAGTYLLISAIPNRDRADSHRAPPGESVHVYIGLDQMHKRVEIVEALDPKKAIAHGE